MKIGDLVTWSDFYETWMLTVGWSKHPLVGPTFSKADKIGIIVYSSPDKRHVMWEDNTCLAHDPRELEVLSEAR